eukprot:1158404-Pelagomonas_calceolata.AAC.5
MCAEVLAKQAMSKRTPKALPQQHCYLICQHCLENPLQKQNRAEQSQLAWQLLPGQVLSTVCRIGLQAEGCRLWRKLAATIKRSLDGNGNFRINRKPDRPSAALSVLEITGNGLKRIKRAVDQPSTQHCAAQTMTVCLPVLGSTSSGLQEAA